MSNEVVDHGSFKAQRPPVLVVLVILSFVNLGFKAISALIEVFRGPFSPEELDEEKAAMIQALEPQTKVIGPELLQESIAMLERQNESFWSMNLINLTILILGFIAVWQMYQLKRKGYFMYLAYLLGPIVLWMAFYGSGMMRNMVVLYFIVFGIVFAILYGVQLKRMT